MRAVPIPGGSLELHDDGLTVTRLDGIGDVPARSHPTPAYRRRARAHGYADVDLMSREHEAAHHVLARALRLPRSPTMEGVARGEFWWAWGKEEAAVLAFQAYARALGVDVVALLEER